jgi:hypothetical protein
MPLQTADRLGSGVRFSDALRSFASNISADRVDLATIAECMGRRSIGALLLILALPMVLPIPAPGISVLFGVPLILVSGQLLIGRRRAWLPTRLARQSISRSEFLALVERAVPALRRFERVVRPRVAWLAGDWAMSPVGAVCLVLAVIITLPVPLGHMLPGAAICVLALGLLERDGLIIGLGLAIAVIALIVVGIASHTVIDWLHARFG